MYRATRILIALVALLIGSTVSAQATRTWVSGVGDDANPCSRTAPCKTFAGAISKTAIRGVINVLDPGGYGGVTITKAITIEAEGDVAGIVVSGTHAIVVNAAVGDHVVLRNLRIIGMGTGLSAVRVVGAGSVLVEDTTIEDFADNGIAVINTTGNVRLTVRNTILRRNGSTATEAGILLAPTSPGSASASLDGLHIEGGTNGVLVNGTTDLLLRDSTIAGTVNDGVRVASVGVADALLDNVAISDGSANGLSVDGANARIRVANSTITGNATGILSANGGLIVSFGNNRLVSNALNNTFSSTTILQ